MTTTSRPTSISLQIAEFVHATDLAVLPKHALSIAKQHFLDLIGCCIAAVDLDTTRAFATLVQHEGGSGEATGIGLPMGTPRSSPEALSVELLHSCRHRRGTGAGAQRPAP